MSCVFTIDLEEGYYTYDNVSTIYYSTYGIKNQKLYENIDYILDLLNKANINATFFVLGSLAKYEYDLIKKISDHGHEISSHGYNHKILTEMTPDELRNDLDLSISAIYQSCGIIPKGYRAPYFSIVKETFWVYDVLKEFDFVYDSSIQPFGYHPRYGDSSVGLTPFVHESGIIEIPLTCAEVFNIRIPCSGGAYFRFYPFKFFKFLFNRAIQQGQQGVFYLHQWELCKGDSYEEISRLRRFRKYHNAEDTRSRLEMFVKYYHFLTMNDLIKNIDLSYANRKH